MKILVLLPRFPYPLDKGDKLRAYHQIVELSRQHDIYLFALSHEPVEKEDVVALQPFCRDIHVERLNRCACYLGVLRAFIHRQPFQLGYWTTPHAQHAFDAYRRQVQPDVVYCQMVRTIPTLNTKHFGVPSALPATLNTKQILDFQDALSLNTRRRMERSRGPLRWVLKYEYQALQRIEQHALQLFDATTVISSIDQSALSPTVALVPNGVDTDYFNTEHFGVPSARPTTLNAKHYSIVFCGNMAYAPNVDAARWLVKEIMPLVWEQCPYGINVLIAGADPKPAVKALAGPKVTVSGRLDDIRTAYASSQIFVAPMRIGSGMQNKLLEAMAMGLPCVTTTLAAAPLGATAWEHLLVGDTAEQLADMIVKLTIEELHNTIADAGHRFVMEHHSWHAAAEPLEALLNQSNN